MKWKLTAALVGFVLLLLSVFSWMVTHTFNADRIASAREFQQRQTITHARLLEEQISNLISLAEAVGQDRATDALFWEDPYLLALEYKRGATAPKKLEKEPGLLSAVEESTKLSLKSLGKNRYAASDENLRFVFEFKDVLQTESHGPVQVLTSNGKVLETSLTDAETSAALPTLLQSASPVARHNDVDYLLSATEVGIADLQLHFITKLSDVLASSELLFQRILLFIVTATFATLALCLIVANRLYSGARRVAQTVVKYAEQQHQADLKRTQARTREEVEMHNVAIVRENLFPTQSLYRSGKIRLYGLSKSTSGSEWWFYTQRETTLFVAVADAAVAEAAFSSLLHSAGRSLFSFNQNSPSDLKHIALTWDRAVQQMSSGQARVAAVLLEIDVELGEGRLINAGCPPPLLFRKNAANQKGPRFHATPLKEYVNEPLGAGQGAWQETWLQLEPEDRLLITTDGYRDVADQAERLLGPQLTIDTFVHRVDQSVKDTTHADATMVALDFKV